MFCSCPGFLEKNRDTFSADLVDLVGKSKSPFLLEIFAKERSMVSLEVYIKFVHSLKNTDNRLIGLFRYFKILTSIRGCEAETRHITLRPKGIRRDFFGVQLHSFTASK
jgi:hypothetical protein